MASEEAPNPMAESGVTMHSDSEQYSGGEELSTSLHSSPSQDQPIILYQPPTLWSVFRGTAINLVLPFINGMMMGFGELFAHEFAFRLGWSNTRVRASLFSLDTFADNCLDIPLVQTHGPEPGHRGAAETAMSRTAERMGRSKRKSMWKRKVWAEARGQARMARGMSGPACPFSLRAELSCWPCSVPPLPKAHRLG